MIISTGDTRGGYCNIRARYLEYTPAFLYDFWAHITACLVPSTTVHELHDLSRVMYTCLKMLFAAQNVLFCTQLQDTLMTAFWFFLY